MKKIRSMKWTYVVKQKLKVALGLIIISGMLIGTNLIDKQHYTQIQSAFNSVYQDRLLVETYIYEISEYLHKKQTLLNNGLKETEQEKNTKINEAVDDLIVQYGTTVLTDSESRYFNQLKSTFRRLKVNETLDSEIERNTASEQIKLDDIYNELNVTLHELSEIQKSESKRIIDNSSRLIASSGITSQFEIGIIILIGVVSLALIFASNAIKTNFSQKAMWN